MRVSCALFLSSAFLSAQRTWVVDNTMATGADFQDLPAACAAAAPGDRIHVRLGDGSSYQLPSPLEKPLTIVGLGPIKPVVVTAIGSNGHLRCGVNELMLFDNLEFRGGNTLGLTMLIVGSRGLIVFSRITARGYLYDGNQYLEFNRVVLVDTTIEHGLLSAYLAKTKAWFLNCRTSTLSANAPNLNGAITGNFRSSIWIVGGGHVGGDGLDDCFPISLGYGGEPAVYALDGPLVVSGPATLMGGRQSTPNPACPVGGGGGGGSGNEPRTSAVSSSCIPGINGTLIDPMVTMVNPIPPNRICPLNQRHEMPAVIPGPAARGQVQTIDTWGPQQSIVSVFASFLTPYEPI
ncbi:MAG: hypothetical protein HZB39_18995, partial [Planctomycetes bacterium]|nr:hypothetical protein [Planctomycetota bacterium]